MRHSEFYLLAAVLGTLLLVGCTARKPAVPDTPPETGGHTEYYVEGCTADVNITDIAEFRYENGDFSVSCTRTDSGWHVLSRGGDTGCREGGAFLLEYDAADDFLSADLQALIQAYDLAHDNGHVETVAGLPEGLGDSLSVTFADGGRIVRADNQAPVLSEEAANAIYERFRRLALANGRDFTAEDSAAPLRDDADTDYLQGAWKGTHFGVPVEVVFAGGHVTITRDGTVTDDVDYVIIDGEVLPDLLREEPIGSREADRYEAFQGVTSLRKKNDFTLSAFVYRDGASSNFELLRAK